MHHGTCVTHVSWCMSGSLTCGGRENVPRIPDECATRTLAMRNPRLLMPSPLCHLHIWHWAGRIPWPLFPQKSFSTISVLAVFIKNTVTLKYILNIIYMFNIWSHEVKVTYRASQHPFLNELNKSLSIQYVRPFKLATTFFSNTSGSINYILFWSGYCISDK